MLTILSTILGFFSSGFPSILRFFQDRTDKKHELDMMQMQIEFQKLNIGKQLEAIDVQAQSAQMQSMYQTIKTDISWVDAYNGIVRPTIALSLFIAYMVTKIPLIYMQMELISVGTVVHNLWCEHDSALFGSIIGFYFGGRTFMRASK